MSASIVISDSEPEREAERVRRLVKKQKHLPVANTLDKGKSKAELSVSQFPSLSIPTSAQRPASASSASSSSITSKVSKPKEGKKPKSGFASAGKILKLQEKQQSIKRAVPTPIASTSKTVLDIDDSASDEDALPPPLSDLIYASVSVKEEAISQQLSAKEESEAEDSPRTTFAKSLSSRFTYDASKSKSAAVPKASSSTAKTNYFKAPEKKPSKRSDQSDDSSGQSATAKTDTKKVEAIPQPLIALLDDCPVCSLKWTTKKSSPVKLSHILKCAKTNVWEIATVLKVIKKRVQAMQAEEDAKKRKLESEQTLFGELVGGKRVEVNVVGVDKDAMMMPRTQGGSAVDETMVGPQLAPLRATKNQVEDELTAQKKKLKKATSKGDPKLAKAIKVLAETLPSPSQSDLLPIKQTSPNELQTYSQSKERFDRRAEDLIDSFGGSGLTQVPMQQKQPRKPTKREIIDVDAFEESSMDFDDHLPSITKEAEHKLPIIPAPSQPAVREAFKAAAAVYRPGSILEAARANRNNGMWALASGEEDVTERMNKSSSSSLPSTTLSFPSSKPHLRASSSKEGFLKPTAPVEQRATATKTKTSDLASTSAKKTTKSTTTKSKATTAPKKSSASASSVTPTINTNVPLSLRNNMPDYSSWSIDQLQKQCSKYGYKLSSEKSVNMTRLEQVWTALHPEKSPSKAKAKAKITKPKKAVTPIPSDDDQASSDDVPLSSVPASPKKRAAPKKTITASPAKKKRAASPKRRGSVSDASAGESLAEEDEEEIVSAGKALPPAEFSKAMRKLVIGDAALWNRIIRYEPVLFDDFTALAKTNGLKATAIGMRNFLDQQMISFYMDQTKGRNAAGGRGRTKKKKAVTSKAKVK